MATENTSPRRSGADWFGLAAFAVLLISSTVLVIRLISTRFLSTGHLLLASGALLVLSGLHGWVQFPRRNKTGGKIVCGVIALKSLFLEKIPFGFLKGGTRNFLDEMSFCDAHILYERSAALGDFPAYFFKTLG